MNEKNKKNFIAVSGMSLALLTLAGCGTETPAVQSPVTLPSDETNTIVPTKATIIPTASPAAVTSSQNTTVPTAEKSTYKDGSYTVVGTYRSPAGPEEIGVTIVLKNDIITESSVDVKATVPKSVKLQQDFADHYKSLVIGKDIDTISLAKVSGASLTPKGFNDALAKIKAEAK